ncbi:Uncharacterized protein FKW44_003681, partial [Caligus rogercresseyi]
QFPMNNYVFTQDGAPAHTFKKDKESAREHGLLLAGGLLALLIAGCETSRLCCLGLPGGQDHKTSHTSVEALKATITKEWDNMSEDFIKTSCASVCPRIEAIIRNNGGHN